MLNHQDDFLVINIIENFLGQPKSIKDIEIRVNLEFNCPSKTCRTDHNKFNLTYKIGEKIYNCWKCKYRGFVFRLVRDYGSVDDLKRLKLITPEYSTKPFNVFRKQELDYDLITCDLPEGFLPLSKTRQSNHYRLALTYALSKRKLSVAQIDKFKIGYAETGSRKHRLIIPSFNSIGRINYFEARAYLDNAKQTYYKPDFINKMDIIFNEKFINWDLPIYLVEGIFDAFRLPNAIPMLGKVPSPLLLNKLIKNNCTVIVCLDSDALKDGVDIYKKLNSLGLNVFFVDLKGKKDISKIFEDDSQTGIDKLLKTICRVDMDFEINKLLNE